jgi:tRNA dimethylallyltransferase
MTKSLIVICGATATGKSALALELAQRLNTQIISADSRQVYREFDLGTAKPSLEELNLVPHYLIDICHPTTTLTLAEYQAKVQQIINSHAHSFLLVGGTGLYIKSIVRGLKIPPVSPHPELRSQLESFSQAERYAFLSQIDPCATTKIHPRDRVRTIRALEVYYVTGKPISQQQGENPPAYPILQIGLDCDSDSLKSRITKRTEKMIELGLVTEVENLITKYGEDLPLLNTLGYRQIKQYLKGDISSLLEAKELIILETRQFAKRQRTWFNADPEIKWFNADDGNLLTRVWDKIELFLK